MTEGKLFFYCRRWNSEIQAKLWIFQRFARGVNSPFGVPAWGDMSLVHLSNFLWFLARPRVFPVLLFHCCLSSTVFQLPFLFQIPGPSLLVEAARHAVFHLSLPLCPQAKDRLAKHPTLLLCSASEEQLINAMCSVLASPTLQGRYFTKQEHCCYELCRQAGELCAPKSQNSKWRAECHGKPRAAQMAGASRDCYNLGFSRELNPLLLRLGWFSSETGDLVESLTRTQ